MTVVHAVVVDTSRATGSLVACLGCGYSVGPFQDKELARAAARQHREATATVRRQHRPPK